MADSSRAQLYFLEETVWGTTPAAALKALRFTGESLKPETDGTTSSEIRSDRQVTDWIRTGERAAGDVNFELSYGTFDNLLEGALGARWVVDGGGLGIDLLENGTVPISFTLEKHLADVAEFLTYRGMRVGRLALSVRPGSILTGTFAFAGKNETTAGVTAGTGAAVAATTTPVMNAVDNVSLINEGGAAFADVMGIDLTVENNLRQQSALANLSSVGVGRGRCVVTGTIEAYFRNRTLYDKAKNAAASSLSFTLTDSAGNAYGITIPKLKYTGREVTVGGNDQDIMVRLPFQSIRDAATDASIQITRNPA